MLEDFFDHIRILDTVHRLIDEGDLKRTKIRGCLKIPVWEIERHEKELEKQMNCDTPFLV